MGIIIMGGTGVGKSTVARLLAARTGYTLYEVGHVVKKMYFDSLQNEIQQITNNRIETCSYVQDIFHSHSKDYFTKERLQYTEKMIRQHGNDYFVRSLLEVHKTDDIIIVGARSKNEINAILSGMRYPYFVGLMCESDRLVNRFVNREAEFMDAGVAKSIFRKRKDTELSWGVDSVMNMCNIVLSTDNIEPEELSQYIYDAYMNFLQKRLLGE